MVGTSLLLGAEQKVSCPLSFKRMEAGKSLKGQQPRVKPGVNEGREEDVYRPPSLNP